jgi:hypothetical protein
LLKAAIMPCLNYDAEGVLLEDAGKKSNNSII